jgi:hypothetical protein
MEVSGLRPFIPLLFQPGSSRLIPEFGPFFTSKAFQRTNQFIDETFKPAIASVVRRNNFLAAFGADFVHNFSHPLSHAMGSSNPIGDSVVEVGGRPLHDVEVILTALTKVI